MRAYRSHVARLFVGHAQRHGYLTAQEIAELGIRLDKEAVVELPYDAQCELSDTLVRISGRSCYGLEVALDLPRGAYGVIEYVLANAATAGACLEEMLRFHRLLSEFARVGTTRIGDAIMFEHWVEHPAAARGRQANEFALAAYLTIGERSIGRRPELHVVRFAHPDPGPVDRAVLEAFFAAPIEFGAARNALVFPAAFLATPIATADHLLHGFLAERAERDLALVDPAGADHDIRAAYRELLATAPHRAQADEVARACGLSTRSMHRRLAAAATTFRGLEADVKRALALQYLADPRRSITDIAGALGFGEASAFVRAFRRWTGKTPRRMRDELVTLRRS